ncbi:MAG: rhodanese-like domain-containing protein [Alphaproteobacteria bacterium]|nr:rhodanese-like domain-containing protein [Alphaproteobacteria bacterium]
MPDGLRDIDAAGLKAALDRGEVRLVDVREPDEHARERIPGATSMPLSRFDPAALSPVTGKKLVLHCATGTRSAEAARRLQAAGVGEVTQLAGGIAAWKRSGYPLAADPGARLPIMRQVQIVAGGLALSGTVLGFTVHPWFFILSGAVGAGLMLAGITGTCMMANLLMKLPYNRTQRA